MAGQMLLELLQKAAASRSRMTVSQTRSGSRSMRVDTMLLKDRDGTLWRDHLHGGLADKKKPQDFPPEKLREGRAVEKEHTSDPAIQTEIAMDHITEDPNYYPKLKRMEEGEKRAGLGQLLKTPIPGTKDWFVNTGSKALQGAAKTTGRAPIRPGALRTAANSVAPAVRASGTMPAVRGGVHGISSAEMQRLGFGDLLKQGEAEPPEVAGLAQLKSKLKPGDILLTRAVHPTIMSRIVSGAQGTQFGHSAMYIGDGKVIDTRNHGKGVFKTSLNEVYKKWGGGRDIKAVSPKATAKQRTRAVTRAKQMLGTPYHAMGAFRLLAPVRKTTENPGVDFKPKKVICSEVIARAYPHLNFADKRPEHVRPVDIAKSTAVKPIALLKNPETKVKTAYTLQGHLKFQGLPIAVENRKGSVRKGVDKDGKPWKTKFKLPYGYIVGTEGRDGEEIDAYVGPHKDAVEAFVVHQRKIDGTGHDEDKVMLGFNSEEEARAAYLDHYNKVGKKLLGPISVIKMEHLKQKLEEKRKHTKLAYVSGGSGAGPAGVRMAMLDMDEKPERAKSGDVPSRDGTNPGAAGIVRREAGPEMTTTLPTNGAQASSGTGATTRL